MTQPDHEPGAQPTRASLAASVFAGVGIGLMVGLMLGLAAPAGDGKSTVAVFIGAVGGALAVFLGLSDRHFSVAKALRIGSFGFTAVIATLMGISIRAHDLLAPAAPSLAEKKAEIEALGYEEPQVLALLQASMGGAVAARETSRSGLHSTRTSSKSCGLLNSEPAWEDPGFGSSDLISSWTHLLDDGSGGESAEESKWMPLLGSVESHGKSHGMPGQSQKNLLFLARDAVCGFSEFKDRQVLPSETQCQELEGGSRASIESILEPDHWRRVSGRVTGENGIVPEHRDFAYRLLGEFLCR